MAYPPATTQCTHQLAKLPLCTMRLLCLHSASYFCSASSYRPSLRSVFPTPNIALQQVEALEAVGGTRAGQAAAVVHKQKGP